MPTARAYMRHQHQDHNTPTDPRRPALSIRALHIGKSRFAASDGGGSDRVFEALVRQLPAAGVSGSGLVIGEGAGGEKGITGVSTGEAPVPQRLWALRQHAQRVLDGPSVDIVSAHFALYALPVLDLLGDRPLIVHFHGPWAEESAVEGSRAANVRLKALIERTVYRRAARCIVLSSAFRDVLHHTYGVPLHRIRIVPGGVEVNRFATAASTQDARATLGWDDRPTVLVVRRLAERMGLTELVEAAAMVREEHPELQVLIAGKGPLHDTLQQAITAHGVEDHVRLLGFVPDDLLPLAYRAADATMVPTQALEGFGLITLESLAAGTPVLVTPVGGSPKRSPTSTPRSCCGIPP